MCVKLLKRVCHAVWSAVVLIAVERSCCDCSSSSDLPFCRPAGAQSHMRDCQDNTAPSNSIPRNKLPGLIAPIARQPHATHGCIDGALDS